ncbi:MAG: peptidylprolyl isomerase [Deltaproteobacteria bacterium]|nr:peptidylprolyl isomerase [Deltaproteobacteria bacterium]
MKCFALLQRTVECAGKIFRTQKLLTKERPRIAYGACHGARRTIGLTCLAMLIGASAVTAQTAAPDRGLDEIARVNGVVITRREFQIEYRQAVDKHVDEGQPVNEAYIAPIRRAVIQRMVEEELLFQESRRLGIVVAPEELDDRIAAARARFDSESAFAQEIARLHMDESQYRRKLDRQMAIDRVIERQVMPSITLSEEEIRQFYDANPQRFKTPEKIRLSHILIRFEPGENTDKTQARRKMETIAAQLAQGADFSDLAKDYSEEPRREHGGDLGYIERGQILPQLETVAFELAVGETSPILTTGHGFHLLRVTDRKPGKVTMFEEAQPEIRQTLLQLKRGQAVKAYVDTIRKKADIRAAQ